MSAASIDRLYEQFLLTVEVDNDVREDVADGWSKQGQNDDNDDCYEDEDECVLNQALPLFLWFVNHDEFSLYKVMIGHCFMQMYTSYHEGMMEST
jgi:hypothetical protein